MIGLNTRYPNMKSDNEWQTLTFQELKVGMLAKDTLSGKIFTIVCVWSDEFVVEDETTGYTDHWFAEQVDRFVFNKSSPTKPQEKLNKVLTAYEIYQIIMSNSRLQILTKKDVRIIERAVLNKMNSIKDD